VKGWHKPETIMQAAEERKVIQGVVLEIRVNAEK
jgi:hypothetical protein